MVYSSNKQFVDENPFFTFTGLYSGARGGVGAATTELIAHDTAIHIKKMRRINSYSTPTSAM
jgi:hypothetical protein